MGRKKTRILYAWSTVARIKMKLLFVFTSCLLFALHGSVAESSRPRGVSSAKANFYVAGKDFTCLDGSGTISFAWVNDDYCDCKDGSDEPGTSACPNGVFNCPNKGYKPKDVVSSRVNDGICDCCDGSDEFLNIVPCNNYCSELGLKMKLELEEKRQKIVGGHQIYVEYAQKGSEEKRTQQARLEELQKQKEELEPMRKQLENIKLEAEKPEREAKERQKQMFDEAKKALEEEKMRRDIENAFADLDANNDGTISVEELKHHEEFDIDTNGEVSDEEAKEYLEDNEQIDQATFVTRVWPNIKDIYKPSHQQGDEGQEVVDDHGSNDQQEAHGGDDRHGDTGDRDDHDHHDDHDDHDHHHDHDDHDHHDHDEEDHHHHHHHDEEDHDEDDYHDHRSDDRAEDKGQEALYDEETKALIAAADKARADYEEIDHRWKDIERDISNARKIVDLDMGPNSEFYPLKDQCFEYSEREYTYKLCPFDSASQRSRNGGGDTRLGYWGSWAGRDDDKYSVMLLDKGQGCWNGPDRSVKVHVHCGQTNELTSASEPSRCEYEMHFNTPAACSHVPPPETDAHDEL